jgi:hypothetical protein
MLPAAGCQMKSDDTQMNFHSDEMNLRFSPMLHIINVLICIELLQRQE